MKGPGKTIGGQAVFWGISERTAKSERVKGTPLHSVDDTREWAKTRRVPNAVRQRLADVGAGESAGSAQPGAPDPRQQWEEFERQAKKAEGAPRESLAAMMQARDFAAFRFTEAAKKNDKADMKFFADVLSTFDGVIHDAQLRAKKLGIDQGELLPRPEVERIILAIGYWMLRSTYQHLDALEAQLRRLAPELDGGPLRNALEGELLSVRFLEPFVRASKIQNGVAVPEWVVAKLRETCGDFLSGGERLFDTFTS